MKKIQLSIFVFLTCLFSLLAWTNAKAQDEQTTETTTTTSQAADGGTVTKTVETTTVVTPVPAPKEVTVIPSGYVSCFNVEAGWFSGVWVPTHRVCQYDKSSEGVVWVDGYWGCLTATSAGVCTNWVWKSGRWEKTMVVY